MPEILKREMDIFIPELGITLPAKIDTGADNSALHFRYATGLVIAGHTKIRRRPEYVPYVELTILNRKVRVNLTDRSEMQFMLLIGVSAIQGYLIDPGGNDVPEPLPL